MQKKKSAETWIEYCHSRHFSAKRNLRRSICPFGFAIAYRLLVKHLYSQKDQTSMSVRCGTMTELHTPDDITMASGQFSTNDRDYNFQSNKKTWSVFHYKTLWLSPRRFWKASFSKCLPSTQKAGRPAFSIKKIALNFLSNKTAWSAAENCLDRQKF